MSKRDYTTKFINPDRGMQSRYHKMERMGGIFLEQNTNPDGWIFSDSMHKERQFRLVDSAEELFQITGVQVVPNYTSGRVELKILNPTQIVDISIYGNNSLSPSRYIKSPTKGLESLVAENGQHITFEPVYDPDVKIHIYPIGYIPDLKK